ncbi:mannose-1-phosphate guanylyltransferase/mannose-6-phosphate isomerase [Kiloniella antarctica]|uniref:mannose-1-phosphate guanylyltransferase n=1 Tax=Kiloniella antarctica TaxID=1550907 RepID=A0ABW5BSQ4_9PROT
MIYPIILSGGSGSRLWPISRVSRPKQFLSLYSKKPLIIDTAERVNHPEFYAPTVVCNVDHRFLVGESFAEAGIVPRGILLEPVARSTAAAILSAVYSIFRDDADATILVMPSDHSIENHESLFKALKDTTSTAELGKIITFGIQAISPEIGYGYIEAGEPLNVEGNVKSVTRFHEKPDVKTATEYLETGRYSWNSGIFMFKAEALFRIVDAIDSEFIKNVIHSVEKSVSDLDFIRLDNSSFSALPNSSFDVAVMEKTTEAAVVQVDMNWSDIGSWHSLWGVSNKDSNGNVSVGNTAILDCSGSLAWNDDGGVTALIGVEDLIVVVNDGSVLVTTRDQSEKVKLLVDQLKVSGRESYLQARTIYRPWGSYRTLDTGNGYLVKRIVVKPGARLSLQYHHHRAEHWVVVSGTARVTSGENVYDLKQNQSTYLPLGTVHRLENQEKVPLVLIEVQTGEVLSEDDIVRLDDIYGRNAHFENGMM